MNPVIGIIGGKGCLGAHFASFFKKRGIRVLISDKGTPLTNKELAKKADITIISVPIGSTGKVIKEVLPRIRKESAIMDFTSVKEAPVKAMIKGKCEVLGMHPMFGNTNPIPGQTVILCPIKKSGKWSKWMEDFLRKNKVKILKMTPKEHDETMGIAQGLIHFADTAFADALKRTKMPLQDILKCTSKASELKIILAARLIGQDPDLYGNIQIANPVTLKYLKKYEKSIKNLIEIIKKKDIKSFEKYFLDSRKYLKGYAKKALEESSYLIDQLTEKRRTKHASVSRIRPTKSHIAILGPENSFSDIVTTEYLTENKEKAQKYYAREIEEIFELVEKGKVKKGIVPIENKLRGTIRETLDNLFLKNVKITQELTLPIHHCLITLDNSQKSYITTIISHPQALSQCKNYLKKHFPKAVQKPSPSTSAAVEKLLSSGKISLAAIASEKAVQKGLKVLAENIEDCKNNITNFLVIEKGKALEKSPRKSTEKTAPQSQSTQKTSIAFHFTKDRPGSLFEILKEFAAEKINLTKIESRPTKADLGDYIFYIDFEGNPADRKVKKTLAEIERIVAKLKILGYY